MFVVADGIFVAGRAQLAHGIAAEEFRVGPAVRIMATQTLPIRDGLVDNRIVVCVDLVTEGAGLRLVARKLERVLGRINRLVAGVAGVDVDWAVQDFEALDGRMAFGRDAGIPRDDLRRSRRRSGGEEWA